MVNLPVRSIVYAVNTSLAALVALAAALYFDLPNPWWAALTVFLVSQPFAAASGAVMARARYRVAGTVLGMTASLFIIPATANSPELLILAIAAWLGLCIYLALLDRGPRSYMFLLAGYSVTIVGLPLAGDPSSIFDSAVWRTEEIGLGCLCGALVHSIVFPQALRSSVDEKIAAALADMRNWISKGLSAAPRPPGDADLKRRIAADLSEVRLLAANMEFEPGVTSSELRILIALEERLVALLPLLVAVEDRLDGLEVARHRLPALLAYLAGIRDWMVTGVQDAEELRSRLAKSLEVLEEVHLQEANVELLATSAVERVAELATVWGECTLLARARLDPKTALLERVSALTGRAATRVLHVDRGLAVLAGTAAGIAVWAAAAVCWLAEWPQGVGVVGVAGGASAVFAVFDDPRPMMRLLIVWTCVAVPVGALYVFAILPMVTDFVTLCLALLPLFLGAAYFLGTPVHSLRGLAFALGSQSLIAVQPTLRVDFNTFSTVSIASVLGAVVALVVSSLIRVVNAQWSSWRLLRAGWLELAGIADGTRPQTTAIWTSRMSDRAGLLLAKLADATDDERVRLGDALRDLRLGVAFADLREVCRAADVKVASTANTALQSFARHFRKQAIDGHSEPDVSLLAELDCAISAVFRLRPGASRTRGLTVTAGLRRSLFPSAPAFELVREP